MKDIFKDEKAIMNPIISCILSLAIIVIMYFLFMPLLWYITNTLIAMGAPATQTLFYMKCAQWGFILFAVGALLILLAKVWKKTHDTGYYDVYR
jgi:hypothetical protein